MKTVSLTASSRTALPAPRAAPRGGWMRLAPPAVLRLAKACFPVDGRWQFKAGAVALLAAPALAFAASPEAPLQGAGFTAIKPVVERYVASCDKDGIRGFIDAHRRRSEDTSLDPATRSTAALHGAFAGGRFTSAFHWRVNRTAPGKEALQLLISARNLDPQNLWAQVSLGRSLLQIKINNGMSWMGRTDADIVRVVADLARFPGEPRAQIVRRELAATIGDNEAQKAAADLIAKMDPKDVRAVEAEIKDDGNVAPNSC